MSDKEETFVVDREAFEWLVRRTSEIESRLYQSAEMVDGSARDQERRERVLNSYDAGPQQIADAMGRRDPPTPIPSDDPKVVHVNWVPLVECDTKTLLARYAEVERDMSDRSRTAVQRGVDAATWRALRKVLAYRDRLPS